MKQFNNKLKVYCALYHIFIKMNRSYISGLGLELELGLVFGDSEQLVTRFGAISGCIVLV